MKYYYFAATLPALTLDAPPPLPFTAFAAACAQHLRAVDRAALEWIAGDPAAEPPPAPAVLRGWQASEIQLRNAVAARRASRQGEAAGGGPRPHEGFRLDIERGVDAAFGQPDPLARERALDALRWRLLEELGGTDPFTTDAVLAYGGRLRLCERQSGLTPDRGRSRFEETLNRIVREHA